MQASQAEGGAEGQDEETRARVEKAKAAEEQRKRMQDANAAMQMGMRKNKKNTPSWLSGAAAGLGSKPKKPRAKKKTGALSRCSSRLSLP